MSKTDPFQHVGKRVPRYYPVNATVLFFDVIGFTKETSNDDMKKCIKTIEDILDDIFYEDYNWNEAKKHNHLIMIPTGDGYAIVFNPLDFNSHKILTVAAKLHLEFSKHGLNTRMGIAKGPNIRHVDLNEKNNIFGYGINVASRVMSLADKSNILVHEDLAHEIQRDKKNEWLFEAGEHEIKHRETIKVFNYYKDGEFGAEFTKKDVVK